MPKKKTKAKTKQQATTQIHPSTETILQITAEELQNIIANALLQAEEQRKQNEKDKQERERQEWRKEIGYKDYSKSNSKFAGILGFLNGIKCGIKMMFMSSAKIKGDKTILSSMKIELSNYYLLYCILSGLLSFCLIFFIPLQYLIPNFQPLPWYLDSMLVFLALIFVFVVLKNRILYFEVDYIKDNNYLIGVLSSHTTRISIIISITSIFIAILSIFLQRGLL